MMQSVCKLPCVETMKLILHAGCDVNAVNTEGNTPLHLAVMFKPADLEEVVILSEMLNLVPRAFTIEFGFNLHLQFSVPHLHQL